MLGEHKPSKVVVEKQKSQLNQIISKVCTKEKIRFTTMRLPLQKKALLERLTNNSFMIRQYIKTRIILRRIIAKLFCKKMGKQDLLILTSDRLSNKENITDYFWGPIIKELNKNSLSYKVVEYDRIESLNSLPNLKKRYIPQKYDAQFIGTYYDASTRKYAKQIVSFLKDKFRQLDNNTDFKNSFNYRGINFYEIERLRLKKIFLTYSHYIADVYAVGKSIIQKETPNVLLVDHERNFYGRALISYAKPRRIPCFCLEGETIFNSNTYLLQAPIDIINDKSSPLWRPLADKKFLWGNYNQEWHIRKNSIPKERLTIVGAPKYDLLKGFNEKDRREIRLKYKVANDEKLITVISAHETDEEEFISSILCAFKNEKKTKVIIKMHPLDTLPYVLRAEAIAKKSGVRSKVVQFEDSAKLIYASDWVITCPSTLVYDSVLLNKKIILYGKRALSQPYVISGLLRPSLEPVELFKELKSKVRHKEMLNEQIRAEFIKKYLFSDDGHASRRVVDVLKKALKNKEIA